MTCQHCNNELQERRVFLGNTGPLCRPRYGKQTFCWYCEWKGTTGPGELLKVAIRVVNGKTQLKSLHAV